MKDVEQLGNRLKQLRIDKNQTLEDVSKGTGISSSLLSKYEKGKVVMGSSNAFKLVKYYNISMDWLIQDLDSL